MNVTEDALGPLVHLGVTFDVFRDREPPHLLTAIMRDAPGFATCAPDLGVLVDMMDDLVSSLDTDDVIVAAEAMRVRRAAEELAEYQRACAADLAEMESLMVENRAWSAALPPETDDERAARHRRQAAQEQAALGDAALRASVVTDPREESRFFDDILGAIEPRFDAYPGPLDPPSDGNAEVSDPLGGLRKRVGDDRRRFRRLVAAFADLPVDNATRARYEGYLADAEAKCGVLGLEDDQA